MVRKSLFQLKSTNPATGQSPAVISSSFDLSLESQIRTEKTSAAGRMRDIIMNKGCRLFAAAAPERQNSSTVIDDASERIFSSASRETKLVMRTVDTSSDSDDVYLTPTE